MKWKFKRKDFNRALNLIHHSDYKDANNVFINRKISSSMSMVSYDY